MINHHASAHLPTEWGDFVISAFRDSETQLEYIALIKGSVNGMKDVLVRIHSGCVTGDIFTSKKCDCREQLVASMQSIEAEGNGVIIYDTQQEGRGLGLSEKIKAYALQENGLDTVQANHELGFDSDLRDYSAAANIIEFLKIVSIQLLTNNPDKINQMKKYGIIITKRVPVLIAPNKHNSNYLSTKKQKMGHLL
jgi:3,4-dihydroxy 2-butanone 4-phosphate synthase / GTP cyclohydrolase II